MARKRNISMIYTFGISNIKIRNLDLSIEVKKRFKIALDKKGKSWF